MINNLELQEQPDQTKTETPSQKLDRIRSRITQLGKMQTSGPWGAAQVEEMRILSEEKEKILSSPVTDAENEALRLQGVKENLAPEERSLVVLANEKMQFQKKKT